MPTDNQVYHTISHIMHTGEYLQLILGLFFLVIIFLYLYTAVSTSRDHKKWPLYRMVFWVLGVLCIAVVVLGPLAERTLVDFRAHMLGHLLLGMLGPLFLSLAAPMTLLLRSIHVSYARKITRLHKSLYFRMIMNPIIISVLNIGGLWLLYTTNLFLLMHQSLYLHFIIHFHIFFAGYFFTQSIITIDPVPWSYSYLYRTIVLLLALASHGILAKYIYAYPPHGVQVFDAEFGAQLMYYAGDAIDVVLIYILLSKWYRADRKMMIAESKKKNLTRNELLMDEQMI